MEVKNNECSDKLTNLEEDMLDTCDDEKRDLERSFTTSNAESQIKMNHSWNLKCLQEKAQVASDEVEKPSRSSLTLS